jgi:hypothetical protein
LDLIVGGIVELENSGYSLGVRRLVWDQEAAGSTPAIPTIN